MSLLKAVPARTTKVVTVGGVLRREEMDLVMNPHDNKAIEAADFVKRSVGGKVAALTMGPDFKLRSIMAELYSAPIEGVDETVILSDRRMAGADTWATAYTVALGIKKFVETNLAAFDGLIELLRNDRPIEEVAAEAKRLYEANLVPNIVYSELPTVRDSVVAKLTRGEITRGEAIGELLTARREVEHFVIFAGLKTTDGETGSTGPQVAEALSRIMGKMIPHITYAHWFEVYPETWQVVAERKIGEEVQRLRAPLPCLLTISTDYRPGVPSIKAKQRVRRYNYRGKSRSPIVWNADDIKAEPDKIGLSGSPTIVGPGMDIGGPPLQKFVGKTRVFTQRVEQMEFEGKKYGPFEKWGRVEGLPPELEKQLEEKGVIRTYSLELLVEELFGGMRVAAKQQ